MKAKTAAAPRRAPMPTEPVFMAAGAPATLAEEGGTAGSSRVDHGGRRRLAGGVGSLRNGGSAGEGTLTLRISGVSDGSVRGVEDLIDHVDNTVCDENIGNGDLGAVYEDATLLANGDCEVGAVEGGQSSAVGNSRRVTNGAGNNVVGQDAGNVLSGEVAKSRANVLESLVGRSKDGDVGCGVNRLDEVGGVQCTAE